jgi:hypothetical protein
LEGPKPAGRVLSWSQAVRDASGSGRANPKCRPDLAPAGLSSAFAR